MRIGEKIKQKRLALDLTLEQLGEMVGVGKSTVRKWETGDIKNMRRDKIALLANALKMSPTELIDENEPGTSAREAFKRNLSYYMKAANVEQADIVAALRITASTVSDWVNGKKYPRVDAMQRLADFLNIPMSVLTAETEPPELTPEQQTKARIHALVDNLSPADIQRAEAVLQALLATQETQPPVQD